MLQPLSFPCVRKPTHPRLLSHPSIEIHGVQFKQRVSVWMAVSLGCYSWRGNCFFIWYTMYCVCIFIFCRFLLLAGEKVWPLINFSVKRCFTAGNGGEIAAEVFCCPLLLLTVLLVTQLISILPTTSWCCHLFQWLIYPTLFTVLAPVQAHILSDPYRHVRLSSLHLEVTLSNYQAVFWLALHSFPATTYS